MTLYFTKDEQDEFSASLRKKHFASGFGFLNSHNGLRPGCMHLLVAGTGAGKSTLTRSLITDLLSYGEAAFTIGVWLSEETVKEYKTLFSLGAPSHEALLNTIAFSEMDGEVFSELAFFEWMNTHRPAILIYDNITTSKFYMDKHPKEQARFATKLKAILKQNNTAGVIIAHADSQQTAQKGGLLDINNIRGSKTICNLSEFAYVFQTISSDLKKVTTIKTVKHRSQAVVHDLYILNFNHKKMSYENDTAIPFKKFKEAYDARNKL